MKLGVFGTKEAYSCPSQDQDFIVLDVVPIRWGTPCLQRVSHLIRTEATKLSASFLLSFLGSCSLALCLAELVIAVHYLLVRRATHSCYGSNPSWSRILLKKSVSKNLPLHKSYFGLMSYFRWWFYQIGREQSQNLVWMQLPDTRCPIKENLNRREGQGLVPDLIRRICAAESSLSPAQSPLIMKAGMQNVGWGNHFIPECNNYHEWEGGGNSLNDIGWVLHWTRGGTS